MKKEVIQGTAYACVLVGVAGLGGAIEHDSGLIQSIVLLLIGAVLLYQILKEERKCDEKEDNSTIDGSSPSVSVDKLHEGE
jgi:hypothetical protein